MPDGSIMKNKDMSSDIVVTKQPVLPKKKEAKQEEKPTAVPKTTVMRRKRNDLEEEFKKVFNKTVYKVLGIPNKSNPSLQEIKVICRKLQLANHPDKGGTSEMIAAINEACNILSSTIKSDETPKEEARKKEAPKEAPKAESGSILDNNFKKVIKMYETFIQDFTIAEFNKAKKQGKGSIINKIKLMNKNNNEVTVNEKNNIVKELNKADRKDDVQTFYSLAKQASTLGKRINTWTKKNLTAEDVKGVKFN